MAMGDDTIANYIQSPKSLKSLYQRSPIVSPTFTLHTFYKSAEKHFV